MPKQKINSGASNYTAPAGTTSRTPVKLNATGTPRWYIVLMLGLMILGLAWLVVNYLAGPSIDFMANLGAWNYLIGFALLIVGLLMTMGWK
ncbi:cell division protein CrgA [Corynebacterium sp. 320]|uniref:Cell division protein CrgA n=1 Tax=Corynebacterium zhongnanshanii TaxID=2768834 RepID=A0ABQ6VCA6_9CORY|nr:MULTISPECIES: cell division protein CrgA [Corynebacterium]KAB1502781.1 cell division protein CrgA [Corynebacterium sp. 320]KAB1550478.1 cell division protein CrgA [Corynebacterium sp. 319]KAB1554791.1 cell division protein CrgA [Corynebacterium sp. 321]KAB3519199.1 cell division protein CrgA [Corynebacterium zhongnanshanii]KAB3526444.1 cell division protein CrgA [Corynebacterium sp. 250]